MTGDNADATIDKLANQLQGSEAVVTAAETIPQPADLIASGVNASGALPDNVNAWFSQIAASAGYQPFSTLAICVAIFAIAYILDRVATVMLLGKSKTNSSDNDTAFQNLSNAVCWELVQGVGLVGFYILSLIAINAMFDPSTEAFELAAVALSSVMLPRAWLLVMKILTGSKDISR